MDRIQYSYYMQRELFNMDLHFKQARVDVLVFDSRDSLGLGY